MYSFFLKMKKKLKTNILVLQAYSTLQYVFSLKKFLQAYSTLQYVFSLKKLRTS